jgi:hypothetical protein
MFVVYHIESTVKIKSFPTEAGAKRSVTCMNKKSKSDGDSYAYCTQAQYENNVVHTKKVVNLMTGKEIEIPSNTPHCCDPSSETYWSM